MNHYEVCSPRSLNIVIQYAAVIGAATSAFGDPGTYLVLSPGPSPSTLLVYCRPIDGCYIPDQFGLAWQNVAHHHHMALVHCYRYTEMRRDLGSFATAAILQ